jgi:hypothetical protein
MNFYPRGAGLHLEVSLTVDHAPTLCQADPVCMNIAAWAVTIAGKAVDPTLCCFDCVVDLRRRAEAADVPINVDRVQGDLCYRCAQRVDEHRVYSGVVGPFCGVDCRDYWTSAPARAGGRS